MANEADYQRIMELGKWLDRFLSAELSSYHIEDLADDALRLLEIDYVRGENDPVVYALMSLLEEHDIEVVSSVHELDGQVSNSIQRHARRAVMHSGFIYAIPVIANIKAVRDAQKAKEKSQSSAEKIVQEIMDATNNKLTSAELNPMTLAIERAEEDNISSVDQTLYVRASTLVLIQHLQVQEKTPWERALSLPAELKGKEVADPLKFLLLHYNDIREVMVEEKRKVRFVKRMQAQVKVDDYPDYINFPGLVAKIFIDFLRAGGKGYCVICKHCGKFTLGMRITRKKYCSDRCRVAYGRN